MRQWGMTLAAAMSFAVTSMAATAAPTSAQTGNAQLVQGYIRFMAYHEAGHALVQSLIDDGSLPLHKVTILPRGRALGTLL